MMDGFMTMPSARVRARIVLASKSASDVKLMIGHPSILARAGWSRRCNHAISAIHTGITGITLTLHKTLNHVEAAQDSADGLFRAWQKSALQPLSCRPGIQGGFRRSYPHGHSRGFRRKLAVPALFALPVRWRAEPPAGASLTRSSDCRWASGRRRRPGRPRRWKINAAKTSFPEWQRQILERQRQKGLENHVLTSTPTRRIVKLS